MTTRLAMLSSKLLDADPSITAQQKSSWTKKAFLYGCVRNLARSWILMVAFFGFLFFVAMQSFVPVYGLVSVFSLAFLVKFVQISCVFLPVAFFIPVTIAGVYCASAANFVFPGAVYLSPAGIAFGDRQRLLPWQNIRLVQSKDLIYRGLRKTPVVEFYVDKKTFQALHVNTLTADNNYHYYDYKNDALVKDDYDLVCVRLPLDLFGFEADRQKFIQTIKKYLADTTVDCLPVYAQGPDSDSSYAEDSTYTAIWLEELRSPQNAGTERLLASGHSLQNNRYKIDGVLGYGGFSVVYRAFDQALAEPSTVAIKEVLINSGGTRNSKDKLLKQIVNEVELLKSLDYQNIVKCLDFFIDSGRVYIVMQSLDGRNLRDIVTTGGALGAAELWEIGCQCSAILSYLHSRKPPVVHRDFTPDNLIWDGRAVKLVDFNVAEEVNTSTSQTVVGKHSYLAPEQWCGTFESRGDLYQLGCTLYFLAVGSDPEPLEQSNPCGVRPDLPTSFGAIVRKLTEREMDNRYASADALTLDLEREKEGAKRG